MNPLQKSICFSISLVLLASFYPCYAQKGYNDSSRLTEQGAAGLYDGSLEVTGVIKEDKWIENVGISTPTTPTANHSKLWLNNTAKQLCTSFDDGSSGCLATGGSGTFLTLSSATATYLQISSATANFIKNTSTLQSGSTFYVSSGAVAGMLTVSSITANNLSTNSVVYASSQVFVPANGSLVNGATVYPKIGVCSQIGAYNDHCFTDDIGNGQGAVATYLAELGGNTIANGYPSYGMYAENNSITNFPGMTFGGLFYAANGQYINIGVEGDAGELSGPTAQNWAVNAHGNSKAGTNTTIAVRAISDGAGTGTAGYFNSSSTGTSIGIDVTASTHAIVIENGDFKTSNSPGANGQILMSSGTNLSPIWVSTIPFISVSTVTVTSATITNLTVTNITGVTSSKLLQTKTGTSSTAINVLSTSASVVSTTSANSISFTPTVTNSTTTITITVNVACDGMLAGSAIYVVAVIDNTATAALGIMQAAGFSGHLVWNQTFTTTKFFGNTSAHTIQVGGYKVGTVTNAQLSGDTAPGTFYTIQEVLF